MVLLYCPKHEHLDGSTNLQGFWWRTNTKAAMTKQRGKMMCRTASRYRILVVMSRSARTNLGDKTVTIAIGDTKFKVHKSLLCEHAPFFRKALRKDWKESQGRVISMPDDSCDAVSLYVEWIYRGRILSRRASSDTGEIELLVNAYVFGDKILDGPFWDAVLDTIIKSAWLPANDGVRYFPGKDAIGNAFEGTVASSPLRRLMVDLWTRNADHLWVKENMPLDFLTSLVKELLLIRPRSSEQHLSDGIANSCSYYQHGDGQLCYSQISEGI